MTKLWNALLIAAFPSVTCAQLPVISQNGIVNAAAYTEPVAPGSIVSILGSNLADGVYEASGTPLPKSLGGTTVTINGAAAPLFYVSPGQINAQVPSSQAFATPADASVVVTTKAGSSTPQAVSLFFDAPGLFTADGSGCGQASALNVTPDGTLSVNSRSNGAAPGDYIALFGTGFLEPYFPPADGSAPATALPIPYQTAAEVNRTTQGASFAGLAAGLVGTDQVNLQIPAGTPDGCAIPLFVAGAELASQMVTISVHSTRGPCVDPPVQAYGTILLLKSIATGTEFDGEVDSVFASFPSSPQSVRPPAEPQTTPANTYSASIQYSPDGTCPPPEYTALSAGTIVLTGSTGSVIVPPGSNAFGAVYSQDVFNGFVFGGTYRIAASGSSRVAPFQGSVSVDPPIQIVSVNAAVNGSRVPISVTWTGGGPNSVVKVSLLSFVGTQEYSASGYALASAGSFTFQPLCTGNPPPQGSGVFCSFGIPQVSRLIVEQVPLTASIPTVQANGISGGVQLSWEYKYVFGVNP